MRVILVTAVALTATGVTQASTKPDTRTMEAAVGSYLAERGDLCLAMYTWPRDVSAEAREAGSNDALQMPVFERLGLVSSEQVVLNPEAGKPPGGAAAVSEVESGAGPHAAGPVTRYSLTAKGQQYFLTRRMTTLNVHDEAVDHDGDFCVAHLSLDKVIRWTPPENLNGHLETTVAYTYKVKPAEWTSDQEVRKVLPRVDMVIRGEGALQLNETFMLQGRQWVPILPGK